MGSPTAFSMLNTSECPSEEIACSLWDILEIGVLPPRYYLSPKACAGLIRRAEARGKTLPELLRLVLTQAAQATVAEDLEPISSSPAE